MHGEYMTDAFHVQFTAGAAIAARRFVMQTAAVRTVEHATPSGGCIGVSIYGVAVGEELAVATGLAPEVESGAAIAAGDPVTAAGDGTGRAVPAAAGDLVYGHAQDAAGAAGVNVTVTLTPDVPAVV